MSPPLTKKQICANLHQQQQQQESTVKSKSIHSHSSDQTSKNPNKQSNGVHSSNNSRNSKSFSSESESPPPSQRAKSPTIHNGQQSSSGVKDRVKGENHNSSKGNKVCKTSSEVMRNTYEPVSPAASTEEKHDNESEKEGKSSSSSSPLSTLPTRCDYVNVIVTCNTKNAEEMTTDMQKSNDSKLFTGSRTTTLSLTSPSERHKVSADSNLVTLSSERIFKDSYLHEAWEKCQYIDLFLYSTVHSKDEAANSSLQNLIPGHRILLSAYSDYIRTFVESYPEPVKFVEQLQSFLKDVISKPSEKESLTKKTKLEEATDMRQLNLKALGMSSIPVLVLPLPLTDLHDLVKLMYRGEVKVDKSRIGSLQKSAFELKVCLHSLFRSFLTKTFSL